MKRQFKRYVKPTFSNKTSELVPVYIRYDYNRIRRTLINTGHKINAALYWDAKKETIKRFSPSYETVLKDLENLENKISNILQYARNNQIYPTCEYVIDRLQTFKELLVNNNKQTEFFTLLDKFIEERESNGNVSPHAIRDYKSLRKHLVNFEKHWKRPVTFGCLDITFYEKFIHYLTFIAVKPNGEKGLKLNSISKQIKNLKVFYNDRKLKDKLPLINLSLFNNEKSENIGNLYFVAHSMLETSVQQIRVEASYSDTKKQNLIDRNKDLIQLLDGLVQALKNKNNEVYAAENENGNHTEDAVAESIVGMVNNFDLVEIKDVYNHFKAGLVDKRHLSNDDMIRFLDYALVKKKIPKKDLFLKMYSLNKKSFKYSALITGT